MDLYVLVPTQEQMRMLCVRSGAGEEGTVGSTTFLGFLLSE